MPVSESESNAAEPSKFESGNRDGNGSIADGSLLLLLLCCANVLVDRSDPGFFALNPTPWIILPMIMGSRHGLLSGLVGSLVTTLVIFIGFKYFKGGGDFADMVTGNAYYFVSLLAAGAIGGLINRLLVGPAEIAHHSAQKITESHQRMQHELELSQASASELAQRLLLHDADFITLQDRVEQLFALDSGDPKKNIERRLLELFRDLFSVNAAAIYQPNPSSAATLAWQSVATIGAVTNRDAATSFVAPEHLVAATAIENRAISTCASVWQNGSPQTIAPLASATLAAIPWSSAPSKYPSRLLLIDRMPYAQVKWENLSRIEALFNWVMTVSASDPDPTLAMAVTTSKNIISPEAFRRQVDLALDFAARMYLTFRLVLFEPPADADLTKQQALVHSAQIHRRPGDTLGGVVLINDDAETFAIGLLMAASTDSTAELRAREILKHFPGGSTIVRYHILTIDSDADRFNHQWSQLIQTAVGAA